MIRVYITAALTAVLVSFAAYGLHCISMASVLNKHKKEIAALATAKDNACATAKAITNEVSDAYQKDLTALDVAAADVDDLLGSLYTPAPSASQPAVAASGRDAAAAEEKLPSGNSGVARLDPHKLIAIGKRAEKTRLQLLACQAFVRRVQTPPK